MTTWLIYNTRADCDTNNAQIWTNMQDAASAEQRLKPDGDIAGTNASNGQIVTDRGLTTGPYAHPTAMTDGTWGIPKPRQEYMTGVTSDGETDSPPLPEVGAETRFS